jgi:hypothetical protein
MVREDTKHGEESESFRFDLMIWGGNTGGSGEDGRDDYGEDKQHRSDFTLALKIYDH